MVCWPVGTSAQLVVPVAAREKAAPATVMSALVPVGSPVTSRLRTPGGIGAVAPDDESPPAQADSSVTTLRSAKRLENRRID